MSRVPASSAPLEVMPDRPLVLLEATIAAQRTNTLGHMRAAEYVALFDGAIMEFFPRSGITDARLLAGDTSPFLLDLHATYSRELRAGESIRITAQVLDVDAQRVRLILSMHETARGKLAATCELAILNMDVKARRPAPWSAAQVATWGQLRAAHASLPAPPQAGRAIGPLA